MSISSTIRALAIAAAAGAGVVAWQVMERSSDSPAVEMRAPDVSAEARDAPAAAVSGPRAGVQRAPGASGSTSLERVRELLTADDYASARALVEREKDPDSLVPGLVAMARGEDDLVMRLRAEQLLFRIDTALAREEHARLVSDRATPKRVRTQAIGSLSQRKDEQAGRLLSETLSDADPAVRAAAARSLGMGGHERGVEALRAALDGESEEGVKSAMIEGVARLNRPEGLALLLELAARAEPGSRLQADLHAAIATQTEAGSVEALLRVAQSTESPELLAAVFAALGSSGDPRAVEVLLRGLSGDRPRAARLEAINGLGLLRDRRAIQALEQGIARADEEERRYLRTALERIRTPQP